MNQQIDYSPDSVIERFIEENGKYGVLTDGYCSEHLFENGALATRSDTQVLTFTPDQLTERERCTVQAKYWKLFLDEAQTELDEFSQYLLYGFARQEGDPLISISRREHWAKLYTEDEQVKYLEELKAKVKKFGRKARLAQKSLDAVPDAPTQADEESQQFDIERAERFAKFRHRVQQTLAR